MTHLQRQAPGFSGKSGLTEFDRPTIAPGRPRSAVKAVMPEDIAEISPLLVLALPLPALPLETMLDGVHHHWRWRMTARQGTVSRWTHTTLRLAVQASNTPTTTSRRADIVRRLPLPSPAAQVAHVSAQAWRRPSPPFLDRPFTTEVERQADDFPCLRVSIRISHRTARLTRQSSSARFHLVQRLRSRKTAASLEAQRVPSSHTPDETPRAKTGGEGPGTLAHTLTTLIDPQRVD